MSAALLLLPDFALILLGYGLRRHLHLGDHFWTGLEKVVYYVLFPALLVNAVMKTPLDLGAAAPLVLTAYLAMGVGMVLGALVRPVFRPTPMVFASVFQCSFRFNTYVALASAGLLFGAPGIATMALVTGCAVPLANTVAVWMLARHAEANVWREIARNPLIWATLAGLALNLLGFVPPKPLQVFLGRLGDASVALGLMAVGAALRFRGGTPLRGAGVYLVAVKLFALPVAALLLGRALGLDGLNLQVAVLFAALPTASSAYILAMRMGGDGQSVAWLISATTVASMFTMPLWAGWLAGS
ncbi:AEC family transporter [Oryzomicrobium sp.]|uniref:AEC family transporter n=1 Tax=Oryzomicrobium sp. TaxID=1911578 RepID=UPI002FE31EB8